MATALAISHLGARPVFVDVDEATLALDPALVKKAITSKTKAVIPVHLYGYPAPVEELVAICAEHHLCLIEDCAQAAGTITNSGKHAGTVGQIGCFSFYPTKNLGAFGDAGYACTSDTVLHQKLLKLRNYGQRARYDHEMTGYNSRLDELHAAVLREKLRELDRWNARRSKIASIYDARAKSTWTLPAALGAAKNAYHLYPIQVEDRDAMVATLKAHGIESLIHYPMLLPEQDAYAAYGYQKAEAAWPVAYNASRRLLSLPINPYVTDDEAEMVARMAFGG
jgi:dTDP-4-amino-4,6-dideoxygalactose transaminase